MKESRVGEPRTSPGQLLAECLKWIESWDYVSFVELENWLAERGMAVKGQHALEAGPNIVLWAGVSEAFCDFARRLQPHIDLAPVSTILVYAVDGRLPDLPVSKRPPSAGYIRPHWLPVTMRPKGRSGRDT